MNQNVQRIANDLGIERGEKEEEASWISRLAYSVAAKRGLDSLWERTTLQHLTKTIEEVHKIFSCLYPDVQLFDKNELVESLQQAGCFYHAPHKASPARLTQATLGGVTLSRGLPIEATRSMSGAGMYSISSSLQGEKEGIDALCEMFCLEKFIDIDLLLASLHEHQREKLEGYEFLSWKSSWKSGYWKDQYDTQVLSLARKKQAGESLLYLYDGKAFSCWALPDYWHKRPWDIANALLSRNKHLPPLTVEFQGALVSISLGYLLPYAEQNFFVLYSWPNQQEGKNPRFSRLMAKPLYTAFHTVMTHLGYTFEERKNG